MVTFQFNRWTHILFFFFFSTGGCHKHTVWLRCSAESGEHQHPWCMGVFILNMVFVYPSCSRLVPISVYIFDLMKLHLGFSAHTQREEESFVSSCQLFWSNLPTLRSRFTPEAEFDELPGCLIEVIWAAVRPEWRLGSFVGGLFC